MHSSRNPLISIVIPLYRSAKTIPKVLESIHDLNYPKDRIEVILVYYPVDDGTFESIKSFKEKYEDAFYGIKIIKRNDKRANVARNLGVKHSTGDYIFLLNDDIVLDPDTLKNALEILERKPHVSIVTFPYKLDPPRIWEEAMFFRYYGKVANTRVLNLGCSILHKEVFEKAGYIREDMGPPLTSNDDFEFSARVNKAGLKMVIDGRIVLEDIGFNKEEIHKQRAKPRSKTITTRLLGIIYSVVNLLKYDFAKGADTYNIVLMSAPTSWKLETILYLVLPFVFLVFLFGKVELFLIGISIFLIFPVIYYKRTSLKLILYFILVLGRRVIRAYTYIIWFVYRSLKNFRQLLS